MAARQWERICAGAGILLAALQLLAGGRRPRPRRRWERRWRCRRGGPRSGGQRFHPGSCRGHPGRSHCTVCDARCGVELAAQRLCLHPPRHTDGVRERRRERAHRLRCGVNPTLRDDHCGRRHRLMHGDEPHGRPGRGGGDRVLGQFRRRCPVPVELVFRTAHRLVRRRPGSGPRPAPVRRSRVTADGVRSATRCPIHLMVSVPRR